MTPQLCLLCERRITIASRVLFERKNYKLTNLHYDTEASCISKPQQAPTLHLSGADRKASGAGGELELERRRSSGEREGTGSAEGGGAQSCWLRHGHGCRHSERMRDDRNKILKNEEEKV